MVSDTKNNDSLHEHQVNIIDKLVETKGGNVESDIYDRLSDDFASMFAKVDKRGPGAKL